MIEIYLDGTQLEVPQDISIGLSLGIADFADPCTASGAYTQTVEIPRTPHNNLAFNMAGEIYSAEMFNDTEHTARVVQDGCELVGGKAYLEGVSQYAYSLQIVGEEIEWVAKIREKNLSELEGESIGSYQPDDWPEFYDVETEHFPKLSWVLLQHGCWFQEADDKKIRRSWVTYHDLVPIVKLHTLLEHIFSHYEIVTSDSLKELLNRTYSTMKWSEAEDAAILEEDMGWELTSTLYNANDEGELMVTINNTNTHPSMLLFDTIVEYKSNVIKGSFNEFLKKTLTFSPTKDCTASLELKTRYQTTTAYNTTTISDTYGTWDDVAIGSPIFADQIFQPYADYPFVQFDVKDSIEWKNKEDLPYWKDYVETPISSHLESLLEDIAPSKMPLMYVEVDNPSKFVSMGYVVDYTYTESLSTQVERRVYYRPSQLGVSKKNVVRCNQASYYTAETNTKGYQINIYPALLDDNGVCHIYNIADVFFLNQIHSNRYHKIQEGVRVWGFSTDQRLTFDVALPMPPQQFKKSVGSTVSTLTFGSSGFGGVGSITVYGSAEGSLKPNFGWGVPIRSNVKLSDIGGSTTAESMLRSIMQLYNLLVYTNPKTKQVFLYSFADFWESNVVDWSDRVDADSDISTTYVGDSIGKEILLSFAEGSPRIDYYNARHTLPYSAFKKALPNKMTDEAKEVQNETLTPPYMVRIKDEFGEGEGFIPSVALPDKEGDVLEFNLAEVPNTLIMIDTSDEQTSSMPPLNIAVFGDVGEIQPSIVATYGDTTLSFSDKDGKVGLHRYYDKQIALWEKAKRLVCYCRVEAWEIEALRYNSEAINFRSLFRLNINGEDVYARLESIEYEPSNTTNKCTFIIE